MAGLRWGELVALTPSRLDLLRGTVDVRDSLSEVAGRLETVPPKTGERRTVPLPRFLCDVLADHLARLPRSIRFHRSRGGPLRRENFYKRIWKQALCDAGLDEATRFHDLRQSAASIAIGMGANVKQVQQMLGHSSATVTLDTYSHIFPALSEQLRDGLDATYRQAQAERDVDRTGCGPKRGPTGRSSTYLPKQPKTDSDLGFYFAGREGLEPPTTGFGDRRSTN
jgi:integrase